MKDKSRRIPLFAVSALVFAAAVIWLIMALCSTDKAAQQRELAAIKQTTENAVTICYAIEGAYPESLQYLIDNYGVTYDESRYLIHYEAFGSNIRPTLTVIERGGS